MTDSKMTKRDIAWTGLKWTARTAGAASCGILLLFVASHAGAGEIQPDPGEWVGLICFPGTVMLGLAVALWREKIGASIALAGCAGFYLWHFVRAGDLPGGPYFLLFTSPAVLFLISGLIHKQDSSSDAPTTTPGNNVLV